MVRWNTGFARCAVPHTLTSVLPRLTRRFLLRYIDMLNRWFNSAFLIHPAIQQAFAEAPAVPQLERRDEALGRIPVQRVAADPQVLGGLADVHYLAKRGLCLC